MKFYKDKINWKYWSKIVNNKLNCIYSRFYIITFYKNGMEHNNKNYAHINYINKRKYFYLNSKIYSNHRHYTKNHGVNLLN